jgi:hypothetical protein
MCCEFLSVYRNYFKINKYFWVILLGWSSNLILFYLRPTSVTDSCRRMRNNYLVLSKHRSYDDSEMGTRRQLKAKVFYQERHISDIKCHQISEKCSCLPSIPTKDKKKKPAYQTWVLDIHHSLMTKHLSVVTELANVHLMV